MKQREGYSNCIHVDLLRKLMPWPWQLEDYAHQMNQYGTLHLPMMEVAGNSLGQDGISNNLQHPVAVSSNPSCQRQPSIDTSKAKCLNQS
jgi:hypothetical protein